ncbi:MAG: Fur family transcriptional regulator [Gammaproteobacteria bacterium]|jgi:Fur family zinc uptake transcriptional regulator
MSHNPVIAPFRAPNHRHGRCLDAALDKAERACKAREQRLTPLRRRVLELIWDSHEPVKAYHILDVLRAEHKGAAPPTVYRTLEFLLRQGLVHRIESLNAYIGCGEPGHDTTTQFLICRRCGEVAELDDDDIIALIGTKAGDLGFAVDSQTVEIQGCCSKCRAG